MANHKDRRIEKYERNQVIYRQNENGNRLLLNKLESEIGDKRLAFRVLEMSRNSGADISTLTKRINNIKDIFVDNGSTKESALAFINNNKLLLSTKSIDVLNSALVVATIFEINGKSGKEFIDFISSQTGSRTVLLKPAREIKNNVDLIVRIFKSKGLSDNEAYKFMLENMQLINLNYTEFVNVLALMHIVSLEDNLLFYDNKNINIDYPSKYVYDAIESLPKKDITLGKIKEHMNIQIGSKNGPKHELNTNFMFKTRFMYEVDLKRKSEENYERTM